MKCVTLRTATLKLLATLMVSACPGLMAAAHAEAAAGDYDLVIRDGRVMNPESGLDAVMNLGITGGRIAAISRERLQGKAEIDAGGLVVAPGFIDLHAHGQREYEARLQVQDGVTTHLEMEAGVYPVDGWYEKRAGTNPINYGATVSHIQARQATMTDLAALGLTEADLNGDPAATVMAAQRAWVDAAATPEELADIQQRVQTGLDEGALGIGYGIEYTPGATRDEILSLFEMAQANGVNNFVHARFSAELIDHGGSVDAVQELIADAAISGAGVHIVHIGSSGGRRVLLLLDMIDQARAHGIDVSTEVYPYTAWSTHIGAAFFDGDFTSTMGLDYGDIELPATGERLTKEQFERIRAEAPETIIVGHDMEEENVTAAVAHPGVMIASDGMYYRNGRAHPRGAGTFSRVLGRYVREMKTLSLMDALAKMSYFPAARLEKVVPQMQQKGRIRAGADADIVIFDPATVSDQATFAEPATPSTGIAHVLVNGIFVVRDGKLQEGVHAGKPVRR